MGVDVKKPRVKSLYEAVGNMRALPTDSMLVLTRVHGHLCPEATEVVGDIGPEAEPGGQPKASLGVAHKHPAGLGPPQK